jgi:hypothetical protein
VEIFDNGDIATASDYGRRLGDFKSQMYPIITEEQLEVQYRYADGQMMDDVYMHGGMMADGGEVYYVRDFYPNYDEDKIANILKSMGAKKVRKAKLYGYSNQPDVVVFEGDKDKAQEILEKEFPDNYISIYEKDWGRKMADGGMMAHGGKLEAGVYRIGKPKRISDNSYEQKIVEIFDNGDIATASDYGRRLGDFKSQMYPIITEEQLEVQYRYADGGMMAHGGSVEGFSVGDRVIYKNGKYPFTIVEVVDDENLPYANIKDYDGKIKKAYLSDLVKVKLMMAEEYVNTDLMNRMREGKMADGGEVGDKVQLLQGLKTENIFRNFPEGKYEIKKIIKGNDTFSEGFYEIENKDGRRTQLKKSRFALVSSKGFMADGGKTEDYYEQLAVYVQGKGEIYRGTSMKKALEKANDYLAKNPKAEIVVVDDKYGDEYDLNGNLKDEYAKGGVLKEGDYVWNALGNKLVVNKVSDDEYFLSAFGQIGDSPFSKEKVEMYLKNGQWSRKPKMAHGGMLTKSNLESIKNKYEENEDENYHGENVILLAENFGSVEDLSEAKRLFNLHKKEGYLSSENGKMRQDLHMKLIGKARAEMKKEGIQFAKGGKISRNKNKNDFKGMFDFFLENNDQPIGKRDLINMAYESSNGVDSAIPQSMVGDVDNTAFYVYDYQTDKMGELVDLRMKLKFSNVKVDVTIVQDGELKYGNDLPNELENATFHQALNYVFTHDDIEQFSIRPRKKFELGGAIEDQYEGRSPQDIWDSLDSYQRYHFIDDHALQIEMLSDKNFDYDTNKFPKEMTSEFVKKAYRSDWKDLDEVVQNRFANHVRQGEYAKGGAISEQNEMNEKVLALIQKANIESKLEFGQLVVSALTDANAHSEVRKFISIIEKKPEWAEKPKEIDMNLPREEFKKQRAKTVYGSKYYDANKKIDDLGVEIANMSGWDFNGILDSLIFASEMSGRNDVAQVLEKLNTDDDKQDTTKNKWEYTDKDEIEYVVVKDKNGKELKFDGKYVISGVHDLLEKGGKLTEIGKYFSKNDVVSVLVNGKNILDKNTVSGVWIDKNAKPMAEDVADTKIGKTTIRKGANGWVAKTFVDNFKGFDWEITTIKNYKGDLTTTAQGGKSEDRGGYQSFSFAIFGDPSIRLKTSRPARVTDKIVSEQHTEAMKDWKERQDEISEMVDQIQAKKKSNDGAKITLNKLADGGAIGFDALAKKVAKNYEGDKVKKEFQDEYGKTYDKKEAEEVGKKVAGKVYRQQQAKGKMAKGGKVAKKTGSNFNRSESKMTIISRKASEIRKANEPWRDAFNRAKAMLYS